jgi:YHS domain-containing protein
MATSIDPVCGMNVENSENAPHTNYEGRIYYFCSDECRRAFDANPTRYIDQAA